jgi:hypothetical protein
MESRCLCYLAQARLVVLPLHDRFYSPTLVYCSQGEGGHRGAFLKGSHTPFPTRYATRASHPDITVVHHGIPRIRHCIVSFIPHAITDVGLTRLYREGTHAKYHYLICGVQGDFTRKLVHDPPTHLWTRQLKFAGVSNSSALYRRGIRVCTGTGIGAALSTCLQVRPMTAK